jgi:hypothetical protein
MMVFKKRTRKSEENEWRWEARIIERVNETKERDSEEGKEGSRMRVGNRRKGERERGERERERESGEVISGGE